MKSIFFEGHVFLHEDFVFPKNAISALYRLKAAGFALGFDMQHLHDEQQLILVQESFVDETVTAATATLVIRKNERNGMILISGTDISEVFTGNDWMELIDDIIFPDRIAHIERNTNETQIMLSVNLDGNGDCDIKTGLYFYDHMLHQIGKHSLIDLYINCNGDLEVDEHHTIEDVAIALGQALNTAIGDKRGIERYSFHLAMDETKSEVAIDLSGRPYLVFEGDFKREYVGDFPLEMLKHFFHTLAIHLQATLHIKVNGENEHHMIESCFKGLAVSLKHAISRSERTIGKLPSSKGIL